MSQSRTTAARGPIKLPYWSRDPFAHLTEDEKTIIRYAEREVDNKMLALHPNGAFCLGVPPPLPGRFIEPESMTVRKVGRKYLEPHPTKMTEPRIYRGRGRRWRLEAERQGRL